MYPLKESQPYPYQQWWVAAYAGEVGRQLLGRTILGKPMVFYRKEDGVVVASGGICPHRMFPLAKGRLVGDDLQCGYHGFTFDAGGRCIRVPTQKEGAIDASIPSYPTVERGGMVWVWTGEAARADPDLIPDLTALGLGNSDWQADESPLVNVKGRYTLLIDNLLDLSHVSFIHEETLPGAGAVVHIPHELKADDKSLNVRRLGRGIPENPRTNYNWPEHRGATDESFDAEYFGPALIRTGGTAYAHGEERELGTTNFIHLITPETPTSTHYWVVTTRNFQIENQQMSAHMLSMGDAIQPQDEMAIAAIEQLIQTSELPREVSCFADGGALQVRRRLEAQIRAEQGERLAAE